MKFPNRSQFCRNFILHTWALMPSRFFRDKSLQLFLLHINLNLSQILSQITPKNLKLLR